MGEIVIGDGLNNSNVGTGNSSKFKWVLMVVIGVVVLIWVFVILFFVVKIVGSGNDDGLVEDDEKVLEDVGDIENEIKSEVESGGDSQDIITEEELDCDDISEQNEKDQCLFDRSLLEGNGDYCVDIVDEGLRLICGDQFGSGELAEGPPV